MSVMPDMPRRVLVLVTSLAFLLTFGLYLALHQQAALAAALISAGVDLVTLVQGYYAGSATAIERWANDLAGQVAKTWGHRRDTLLREAGILITAFQRVSALEDGELPDEPKRGDWNSVAEFFLSLPERKLVVLGEAGSGKTLIILQLVVNLLNLRKGAPSKSTSELDAESLKKIPVPISVIGWDSGSSLTSWLIRRLRTAYLVPRRRAALLVKNGYVLPVLDGLDEATRSGDNKSAALSILYRLNVDFDTTDSSGQSPLVLTSRTSSYVDLPDPGNDPELSSRLANAVVIRMRSLTESQVIDCLRRKAEAASGGQIDLLNSRLIDGRYGVLAKALTNPLTLMLALRVARSGNLNLHEISTMKSVTEIHENFIGEYPRATVDLYPKRFGRANSVAAQERTLVTKRGKGTHYPLDDAIRWLYQIARSITPQQGSTGPSVGKEYELEPRDYWEAADNRRSAILRVHLLIATIAGLVVGTFGAEVAGGKAGITCWVVATVLALGFAMRVALPHKPKMSKVDFRQLIRSRAAFYLIPIILITGLLAGLAAFHVSGQASVGVTEGLAATALAILLAGRSRGLARAVEPLDGLSNDLRFGLTVGIVGGVALGFPGGLTGGLWSYLHLTSMLSKPGSGVLALIISIPCGVALGSGGWVRLQIAAILSRGDHIPRKPVAFLRWAEQTGLLRASGTAYQFRHNDLRTWLINHSARWK